MAQTARRFRRAAPGNPRGAGGLSCGQQRSHAAEELVKASRIDSATAILEFQGTAGGGARDRLCELTLDLGLIHDWLPDVKSRDTARRRVAFANLAFVCSYEPCLRLVGDLLVTALEDRNARRSFRLPAAYCNRAASKDNCACLRVGTFADAADGKIYYSPKICGGMLRTCARKRFRRCCTPRRTSAYWRRLRFW